MLVAMGIPAASAQTRPVDAPSSRTDDRADWGRVQHLASGAAIIIAIGEAPPGPRIVIAASDTDLTLLDIAASDTDLTLLDIADEQLDASLRRALRRIATDQRSDLSPTTSRRLMTE